MAVSTTFAFKTLTNFVCKIFSKQNTFYVSASFVLVLTITIAFFKVSIIKNNNDNDNDDADAVAAADMLVIFSKKTNLRSFYGILRSLHNCH